MTATAPVAILRPEECDAALLALNNDHAEQLSILSAPRLRELVEGAFLAARIGGADALLIAFDQDAAYDSPNFLWFRKRYPRFVYVDRVVVAADRRGRGLATQLYGALDVAARRAGHDRIACEINRAPPNPGSIRFHRRGGFVPVGESEPADGKPVSYWLRRMSVQD